MKGLSALSMRGIRPARPSTAATKAPSRSAKLPMRTKSKGLCLRDREAIYMGKLTYFKGSLKEVAGRLVAEVGVPARRK